MPELPEVETVRRSLVAKLCGRIITNVTVNKQEVLINEDNLPLAGWQISGLRRRGKYLLIDADSRAAGDDKPEDADIRPADDTKTEGVDSLTIIIHLRMTGQLLLDEQKDLERDHVHVIFELLDQDSGSSIRLLFRDVRRFGRIWYYPGGQETRQSGLAALGPEPLGDWQLENFAKLLARRPKATIKNVLLDQHVVAGLGNIYVDEALFAAGISPVRPAASISQEKVAVLYKAVKKILEAAIGHRGTSFRDYVDGLNTKGHFQYELKVYGRGGQQCKVCGELIEKRRVAGRGTCSCPRCQPEED